MRYYAQKLAGTLVITELAEVGGRLEGEDTVQEGDMLRGADTDPLETQAEEMTEDSGGEDFEQPILAMILKVVNKCTASVNTLQGRFGELCHISCRIPG